MVHVGAQHGPCWELPQCDRNSDSPGEQTTILSIKIFQLPFLIINLQCRDNFYLKLLLFLPFLTSFHFKDSSFFLIFFMLGVTFVSAGGLLVFTNIKPDVRFEIDLRLTWNWNAATQMFCENIFFRSLVQSYSYIMKLYPLYIVHISPPHSRPFQHQHRKPAPLLCHCAFLYLGVLPDQNLCQEPTPQVSPSLT